MKILHCIRSVNPEGGGPIEGVKQRANVLTQLGHELEVVSLDDPDAPWLNSFPLKVHALGPSFLGYGFAPRYVPWLRDHASDYDAVIINGIWQYNAFGAWRALRGTKVPYFVFTHGMLDPWFKKQYPLKHLKKWLYWPWGDYRVLRDAKLVLFTSEEERIRARQSFCLYRCNEQVVTYGTSGPTGDADLQRNLFFEKFPQLSNKRILLYLSRIHPKKGCDLLIEAFSAVAGRDENLHLVIAGPDQVGWEQELLSFARRLGVDDRITWPGMLSGDLKWGAYHVADAFVLPSHQENFGIVIAEALACGVPVLISNKVNIWHEIHHDGAGLVAEDDSSGTQALLDGWLDMNETQKNIMRIQALTCFTNRFEIATAANSLIKFIQGHLS